MYKQSDNNNNNDRNHATPGFTSSIHHKHAASEPTGIRTLSSKPFNDAVTLADLENIDLNLSQSIGTSTERARWIELQKQNQSHLETLLKLKNELQSSPRHHTNIIILLPLVLLPHVHVHNLHHLCQTPLIPPLHNYFFFFSFVSQ